VSTHDRADSPPVDGVFGLWAACSPRYRDLVEGFADADSWATDGHRWPNVGYDCGLAFVRQPDALRTAMASSSVYFVVTQLKFAASSMLPLPL
jgi:glutamate/tyrosine decarboxylase-like PLP-dependent enzyme